MNIIPFPAGAGQDPTEMEKSFFSERLREERAALGAAADEQEMSLHRRLIARYETVLKLYEESEAELQIEPRRGRSRRPV